MNRQAYLLSAARPNASSAIGFKHNCGCRIAYSLVLYVFVKALMGKSAAAADMLIFDTLLIEVSRETAVSLRDLLSRLRRMSSAFDPRARLLLYRFGAPVLLTAERGACKKSICNTRASCPSRELGWQLCWTCSVLLPVCAEIVPHSCSPQLQRLPAARTPASRQGR